MADQTASPFTGELYTIWEQSMTRWWDQVLDSNATLKAMGEGLSAQTKARAGYESSVDDTLTRMHLPTRTDVIRLAKIAAMLEDRLLAQEDVLLEVRDQLVAMEKIAIQARIEAAETRLELRERLAVLQARIDTLEAPATPAAPRTRRKKSE
ncbi:MAG: hypothetical protein ACI8RZ_006240 [Myxococcota bacterium]|jgi:hypothetical protein